MDSPAGQQVALVTGGSSGIGAAIARALSARGTHVVVNSRSSVQAGEALAAEIGGSYRQADVADPDAARALVAAVVADHGRLDVLVNNAGTTVEIPHADLEAATPEVWLHLYSTNVVAPFVLTTAAVPALREAGGCVVNIGSLAGVRPVGSSIPYAASKAALHHQTRLLAATLGPRIRVNAVAPGLVDTPWTAEWSDTRSFVEGFAPLARSGQPADVVVLVLALIDAGYTTGEVWVADGGLQLR